MRGLDRAPHDFFSGIGNSVVREEPVMDPLRGCNRTDVHFTDKKSYVAIVAGVAWKRAAAGAQFHRQEVRCGWNGNAEALAKINLAEASLGFICSHELLHIVIEPILRQPEFLGHSRSQLLGNFILTDDPVDVMGRVARAINQGEDRAAIEGYLEGRALLMRQFS